MKCNDQNQIHYADNIHKNNSQVIGMYKYTDKVFLWRQMETHSHKILTSY